MTQNKQKITPANYADELDVYEALYSIQKSKGTELLSPKQLQLLIDSGRVSEEKIKEINLNKSTSSILPPQTMVFIDLIVYGIFTESAKKAVAEFSLDPKDEVLAKKMGYEYFRHVTGLAPNQFKKYLVQEFENIWRQQNA